MTKWIVTSISVIIALILVSSILVLIFGSVDKTPYLIKFLIGGGVPFWVARIVFRHFQRKERSGTGSRTEQPRATTDPTLLTPAAEKFTKEEPAEFSCSKCESPVTLGMSQCPHCNEPLEWEEDVHTQVHMTSIPVSSPSEQPLAVSLAPAAQTTNALAITVFILGCIALLVVTVLNTPGNTSYVLGAYIAKLFGYTFFLGLPTFLIARGTKKPLWKAFSVFAWLFLAAALFGFVPYLMRPSFTPAETKAFWDRIGSYTKEPTAEEVITLWDAKLSAEQRRYRAWSDSLNASLSMLSEPSSYKTVESLDRHIATLSGAQSAIQEAMRRQTEIFEKYGPALQATIHDPNRLSRFSSHWHEFTENVAIVFSYDSKGIGQLIDFLSFLKRNRSRYFFLGDQIEATDDTFLSELVERAANLEDAEMDAAQQTKRNDAIIAYSRALDIARGK